MLTMIKVKSEHSRYVDTNFANSLGNYLVTLANDPVVISFLHQGTVNLLVYIYQASCLVLSAIQKKIRVNFQS